MFSSRSTVVFRALLLALAAVTIPACGSTKKSPPIVLAVLPAPTASSGIGLMPNIIVQFDRAMDDATVQDLSNWAVVLSGAPSGVPITVQHLAALNQVRIIPTSLLQDSSVTLKTYGVFIGGSLKSTEGREMGGTIFFSFDTTAAVTTTSVISWAGAVAATGASGEITLTFPSATESAAPITATYDIYLSTSAGTENLMLPPLPLSPTTSPFTITGLTPTTAYFIKVQPRDGAGAVFTPLVELTATSGP